MKDQEQNLFDSYAEAASKVRDKINCIIVIWRREFKVFYEDNGLLSKDIKEEFRWAGDNIRELYNIYTYLCNRSLLDLEIELPNPYDSHFIVKYTYNGSCNCHPEFETVSEAFEVGLIDQSEEEVQNRLKDKIRSDYKEAIKEINDIEKARRLEEEAKKDQEKAEYLRLKAKFEN